MLAEADLLLIASATGGWATSRSSLKSSSLTPRLKTSAERSPSPTGSPVTFAFFFLVYGKESRKKRNPTGNNAWLN